VAAGYGCNALGGGQVGWATKARKPKVVARAGEEVEAAAARKVRMAVVGGRHAQVPKVGKAGGGMVVAGP
jgi:hypothetical protein